MSKTKTKKSDKVCIHCNKKLTRASYVIAFGRTTLLHALPCGMEYLIQKNNELPENEQQKNMKFFDTMIYYTEDYEQSTKAIPVSQVEELKKEYRKILFSRNPLSIKIKLRDIIWSALEKKYCLRFQNIKQLNEIWNKGKDNINSNFYKSFIPSVLKRFQSKGYLSNKQWDYVTKFLSEDRPILPDVSLPFFAPQCLEDLELPDKLRLTRQKINFVQWYNKKEGIREDEEK